MGGFGTSKIPLPRDLVIEAPRLSLKAIPRFGQSVELTWESPKNLAAALHAKVTRTAAGLELETGGSSVLVRLQSWPMPHQRGRPHGVRLRMTCPACGESRDALHWRDEWGCRECHGLAYPSRHQQRWCPAIRRRARLLRKLARVSPKSLRGRWLRAQIAREERAMIANLKRANRDLTKRVKRYGRSRRIDPGE